jgi:hypothetical protein
VFKVIFSKTFLGALVYVATTLVTAEQVTAELIGQGVGVLLAGLGLRHAVSKGSDAKP